MSCCFTCYDEAYDQVVGCQFEMDESDLFSFNGNTYCEFHLPLFAGSDSHHNSTEPEGSHKAKCLTDEQKLDEFYQRMMAVTDRLCTQHKIKVWEDYSGVVFPGDVSFENRRFDGVRFNGCTFHGIAAFTNSIFIAAAEFKNTTFLGPAEFHNTNFSELLYFDGSVFKEKLIFSKSGDLSELSLAESGDREKCLLYDASSGSNPSIDDVVKIPGGRFVNCVFESSVSFNNREFTNSLNFKGATFHHAPEFFNCTLHQESYFPDFRAFKDTKSEDSFHRYRVLKLGMENARSRIDEGGFFALEQRSFRRSKSFVNNYLSLSFLYDLISEYGMNTTRVGLWFLLIFVGFTFCYSSLAGGSDLGSIVIATENAITNIVKPFNVWRASESQLIGTRYFDLLAKGLNDCTIDS